jgi:hypothetical protein
MNEQKLITHIMKLLDFANEQEEKSQCDTAKEYWSGMGKAYQTVLVAMNEFSLPEDGRAE